MTVPRPDLTAGEFDDTREAFALANLGKPIPSTYRPAALKVAAYCLARAYDHDDDADARPLFAHPDGGREGHPGIYGTNRTMTPAELATWITKTTRTPRSKGTGWMFSPGHSFAADTDGAAPFPLGPRQRTDARCRAMGWLIFDADGVGEWTPTLDALGMMGGAFVRSRSSGHCTLPSCSVHRGGAIKWHLVLPLRSPWAPPENVNLARAVWKGALYPAARFVLHVVGELSGKGFDRPLDQLLARMYVGAPGDFAHWRVPREVSHRDGLGFDVEACFAALEELGVVDPAEVRAERERRSAPAGAGWSTDAGDPPMVVAFHAAGLYVRPLANGNHAVGCPWESLHTSGRTGDSSTVLFPNGIFHCSHSHPEGKAPGGAGMREVLAMLPVEAQAAHRRALPRRPAGPVLARPQLPPSAPTDARDAAHRALLAALALDPRDREALCRRGLDDDAITANGYRTLPAGNRRALAERIVAAVGADAAMGVPGIARTADGWTFIGWPGLLVPVRALDGRITGLMVRRPDGSDAPISGRKHGGAPAVRAVHVPVAAAARRALPLVITVGALAADVATALSGRPVVGLPGAAAWRLALDLVDAWGAADVAVVLGGGRTAPDDARALVCLVDALRAEGARVSTLRWGGLARGFDDFLLSARRRGETNHAA